MRHSIRLSLFAVLVASVACGSGEQKAAEPAAAAAPAATGDLTPAAGGKIIEISMTTDDKGNYYSPAEVTANPGDVLHFKLVVGVHNVHFLPDSNPGKTGLPPVGPLLQLPGQTYDVAVDFGDGTFYWQCDPHAALGMKGHLTVVSK